VALTDRQRLQHLVRANHPCIAITTHEEDYALPLVVEVAAELGEPLQAWSVVGGLRDGLVADSPPLPETEHPAAALYKLAQEPAARLCVMLDLAGHLNDQRTLRLLRDVIHHFRRIGATLILIDHLERLPPVIAAEATRFEVSLPDEKELESITRAALSQVHRRYPIKIDLTRGELRTIIRNLQGLTRRQAKQIIIDAVTEDRRFAAKDINAVLALKRQTVHTGGLLEYVETPVDLSEIGGLRNLKAWLKKREGALTDRGEAFGLRAPRGVLMVGVQGAGKSLCAKAIAAAWQRPLLRMDPGALYDRYVGESERRLREALRQAEMMAPIVLWIDEIEKAFASAASRSTDGGLSQRMFGTLLTWMQEHQSGVFLVATANEIDALPPELLRKGRFDEIFFVDLPDRETRKEIFAIHLAKRDRDPEKFDLDALADVAQGYSGAEIEQAVLSAMHDAFDEGAELDTQRVAAAVEGSPPLSVTMAERVDALHRWANGRCVSAG